MKRRALCIHENLRSRDCFILFHGSELSDILCTSRILRVSKLYYIILCYPILHNICYIYICDQVCIRQVVPSWGPFIAPLGKYTQFHVHIQFAVHCLNPKRQIAFRRRFCSTNGFGLYIPCSIMLVLCTCRLPSSSASIPCVRQPNVHRVAEASQGPEQNGAFVTQRVCHMNMVLRSDGKKRNDLLEPLVANIAPSSKARSP